jgi:hypothetical protein
MTFRPGSEGRSSGLLTPSRRAEAGRGMRGRVASAVRRVRLCMASLFLSWDERRAVMDCRGDGWDGEKAAANGVPMIMAAVIDRSSFIAGGDGGERLGKSDVFSYLFNVEITKKVIILMSKTER